MQPALDVEDDAQLGPIRHSAKHINGGLCCIGGVASHDSREANAMETGCCGCWLPCQVSANACAFMNCRDCT